MAKCANCANEAYYTYAITPTFGIDYCSRHVPKFLHAQKISGMMPLRGVAESAVEEPVIEEPVIEEPVVEEVAAPVEEPVVKTPAPKKSTKKKTS
jgi:hypothetical protein